MPSLILPAPIGQLAHLFQIKHYSCFAKFDVINFRFFKDELKS